MDAPRINSSSYPAPPPFNDQKLYEDFNKVVEAANKIRDIVAENTSFKEDLNLLTPAEKEAVEQSCVLEALDHPYIDYKAMIVLLGELTLPKHREEAIAKIIRNLAEKKNQSDLVDFVNRYPVNERNGLLLESASILINQAKKEIEKQHQKCLYNLDRYIEIYGKYQLILNQAITTALRLYPLIIGIKFKCAFIKRLISSSIQFPEIPLRGLPDIFASKNVPAFRFATEDNTALEKTRERYQVYLSERTKDYFKGTQIHLISYYEFLALEAASPENPAASAASTCKRILEYFAESRKSYQASVEHSTLEIRRFQETETARIKDAILSSIITFHIEQNNVADLSILFSALLPSEVIPKARLKAAEIALAQPNIAAMLVLFQEIIRCRAQYAAADQPSVDAIIARGAALLIKNKHIRYADEIFDLISAKKE